MAQTNRQDHERLDINDLSAAIREEEPVYGDSSGPLFAIYTTSAEKRDNRVFARWQKDADGIIIFVCRKVAFSIALYELESQIERFILRRRRRACRRINPRPQP
jgi:hypothetical protein